MKPKVFTTAEAARACGKSSTSIKRWFDSGELLGYRIPGSQDRRIPWAYLVKFCRTRKWSVSWAIPTSVLLVSDGSEIAKALAQHFQDVGRQCSVSTPDTWEADVQHADPAAEAILTFANIGAAGQLQGIPIIRLSPDMTDEEALITFIIDEYVKPPR